MKEIEKIVVPIDYFKNTNKLIEYAVYIGAKLSASIRFIHVVEQHIDWNMVESQRFQEFEDDRFVDADLKMLDLVEDYRAVDPGCEGQVIPGDPVDEIVEFAESQDADLIIISTHGTKGQEKILMGSVTKRVLKRAHCSVLVINPLKEGVTT